MQIKNSKLFEQLIDEALKQEFSGWDFSFIANRWQEGTYILGLSPDRSQSHQA